jgi:hypothetical protein
MKLLSLKSYNRLLEHSEVTVLIKALTSANERQDARRAEVISKRINKNIEVRMGR